MFFKIYESQYGKIIAACDRELSGRHLKFGKIDFFVNPRFYGEQKASEDELLILLKDAVSCNLVGKKSVECGIKSGLVAKENIMMIGKTPHAQAFVMKL